MEVVRHHPGRQSVICTIALMRHGGSHLIRPVVAALQEVAHETTLDFVLELLSIDGLKGPEIVEPGKFGAPPDEARGAVVVFLRDPRDRMVATHRWWSGKPRKAISMAAWGDTVDAQIAWLLTEGEFLPEMLRWARVWCKWPDALTARFEDMRVDGCAEVTRIASHLHMKKDTVRDAAIFGAIYGRARTYTGSHSDWRQTFGPLSNAAWAGNGGPELLELMGYE